MARWLRSSIAAHVQGAYFARLEASQLAADVAVVDVLGAVHAQMSGGSQPIGIVSARVMSRHPIELERLGTEKTCQPARDFRMCPKSLDFQQLQKRNRKHED